jgi:HPt (histidine-containing phosphotransfer) domain-containing protein
MASDDLIDIEVLSELSISLPGGFLARTLRSVCNDIRGTLPEIAAAAEAGDIDALGERAHRLSGSVAIVGASVLHAGLARVENACREGRPEDAVAAAVDLAGPAEETRLLLEAFAAEYTGPVD